MPNDDHQEQTAQVAHNQQFSPNGKQDSREPFPIAGQKLTQEGSIFNPPEFAGPHEPNLLDVVFSAQILHSLRVHM